jgi:predicted transcriptional regulator
MHKCFLKSNGVMHLSKINTLVIFMVDLSCIDLSVEDLLRCSFGLSRLEVTVFMKLLKSKEYVSVSYLSASLGRERSVVQRGLAGLMKKGLTQRDQSNKDRGGYEFLYKAKNKNAIKASIVEKSRCFCKLVQKTTSHW